MSIELNSQQQEAQAEFRAFADAAIFPFADQFDGNERIPTELIGQLAQRKYLGAVLPEVWGGRGLDLLTFGLLNEEIGRACSSTRSLLTVHSMVAYAILRWGSPPQKQAWLPRLAGGHSLAAFALTEPNIGSDAKHIESTAEPRGDGYILNGRKKWITFGQIADLFLVFAQCNAKPSAFLVERTRPGLTTRPMRGLLGTRASMLAEVSLEGCPVPRENLLGGLGFGFSTVALSALDLGRYSVAWGSVGIGQACLEASLQYATERKQFGEPLSRHQLIQEMIANMVTQVKAARLLCCHAGYLKDIGDPESTAETLVAKYFASTMAARVASDAVQIHGGNGCGSEYPVQRYLRDAKVMEIIEGSNQMQQILISRNAFLGHAERRPGSAPQRAVSAPGAGSGESHDRGTANS
ncbi:MAG TPA: acyl-CoA dehydrogenase family protein [Anaerolineae bacterium]|nr:acyl-CoA dehydrogenase family protein [Anaerolineae bacterium]